MENKKIAEYCPSNEGLKNIYSKFKEFEATVDLDNIIILYTEDIKNKVINCYIKDNKTKEMVEYTVDYSEYIYGE